MATKLDHKYANGIIEGVNVLISEVQRLESQVERYERAIELTQKLMTDYKHNGCCLVHGIDCLACRTQDVLLEIEFILNDEKGDGG